MLDQTRNGFHGLVREDHAAQSFSVKREVFVSPEVLEREEPRAVRHVAGFTSATPRNCASRATSRPAGLPDARSFSCADRTTIRALINSCRHRGAVVCREREGNARQFFCMYHGWTYHSDGALKGVPGEDAYPPAFDKSAMGLAEVPRLEHYRDFYFLNFDRDAVDLKTYLAGATEYIDLVIDQSPSGKMEIISGTQEYDIKANWKLLVENSVDDYHLLATHSTWLNYMRNSGVNDQPPKDRLLLPTRGRARTSATVTSRPTIRISAAVRWRGGFRSTAKTRRRTSRIRAELVSRLGETRAARVADTNRNLVIFPNLVINDGSSVTVRNFYPVAPDLMHVTAWALGPVEETEAQRARRLHAFLTFYGPGGFATPDDVAALEAAQQGYAAWREVEWNDLSRGMANTRRAGQHR